MIEPYGRVSMEACINRADRGVQFVDLVDQALLAHVHLHQSLDINLGVNLPVVNNNVDSRSRLLYQAGMAKTPPLGVRLDPEVKAALERAAAADDRPLSALIAKIVAEWVRREGWLKR